jgi:hypothetical protein
VVSLTVARSGVRNHARERIGITAHIHASRAEPLSVNDVQCSATRTRRNKTGYREYGKVGRAPASNQTRVGSHSSPIIPRSQEGSGRMSGLVSVSVDRRRLRLSLAASSLLGRSQIWEIVSTTKPCGLL